MHSDERKKWGSSWTEVEEGRIEGENARRCLGRKSREDLQVVKKQALVYNDVIKEK